MRILITGAAGFIGFHAARRLAELGHEVVGIDNFNAYYDPALKRARVAALGNGARVVEGSFSDHAAFGRLVADAAPDVVVHLGAQAGVRYSLDHPFEYADANLIGQLSVLEACRHAAKRPRLVYASSSSVYGDTATTPVREDADTDEPVSLYAATKKGAEAMSSAYAHLYGIEQIGLRFFTVYGPWGRPDMAVWRFTEAILDGRPIELYNEGRLSRDFTYIDDVVAGLVAVVLEPARFEPGARPHRIYNIGNSSPVTLDAFVAALEAAIGKKAEIVLLPMQAGDVHATHADTSALAADYGYASGPPLAEGLGRFVSWCRGWRGPS